MSASIPPRPTAPHRTPRGHNLTQPRTYRRPGYTIGVRNDMSRRCTRRSNNVGVIGPENAHSGSYAAPIMRASRSKSALYNGESQGCGSVVCPGSTARRAYGVEGVNIAGLPLVHLQPVAPLAVADPRRPNRLWRPRQYASEGINSTQYTVSHASIVNHIYPPQPKTHKDCYQSLQYRLLLMRRTVFRRQSDTITLTALLQKTLVVFRDIFVTILNPRGSLHHFRGIAGAFLNRRDW